MFKICDNKGFHLTFDNGWTVSVQFGPGNYSDNHHADFDYLQEKRPPWSSTTAEVAAFKGDTWLGDDDKPMESGTNVRGWQTPAQVLDLLNKMAKL
jgi:hypothetical protein